MKNIEALSHSWITPDWPVPLKIKAVSTTRIGGGSLPPFDAFNLGAHVGDLKEDVLKNRALLVNEMKMSSVPAWLNQVHGIDVVSLPLAETSDLIDADASYTREPGQVCTVMTADCLPVLFCDESGLQVAAAHAGWRGLLNGVLEGTLSTFFDPKKVMAWLGPAIGPACFEVGNEVRRQFLEKDPHAKEAFISHNDRWLANIYWLAKRRLTQAGVVNIYGGNECTFTNPTRFFSYRRENKTGRQASCIWIEK